MDFKAKQALSRNYNRAMENIKASRGLSALGAMADNICFLYLKKHNGDLDKYISLYKEAFEMCGKDELLKTFDSDIEYAKRIAEYNDLVDDESDLLYSLVGGVLSSIIALGEIGVPVELNPDWQEWIEQSVLTRDDLLPSENSMSRAYALYINVKTLLQLIKMK